MEQLNNFWAASTKKPNAQILLAHVPHPEQFGVAELLEGRVIRLEEKPKHPRSDLALCGVYMFDQSIFAAVDKIKPSVRHELEITDAIQYLIDIKMAVHPYTISGWWKDTGKLEDMLEANSIILDTFTFKNEGRVDSKSKIEGKVDVVILEGSGLGAKPVDESELLEPINYLERKTDDAGQMAFRLRVNRALADYQPLFALIDGLVSVHTPNLANCYRWRQLQEEGLIARQGKGMEPCEIRRYVDYCLPTVHRYTYPLGEDLVFVWVVIEEVLKYMNDSDERPYKKNKVKIEHHLNPLH